MKILALETSTETPVFAAVELNENLEITRVATRVLDQPRQLSGQVMLSISAVLDEAGWTLNDVDAIAAGIGPGSWTGLRIGLTTAKTIAQARNLPLVGVPTLDALAFEDSWICLHDPCLKYAFAPCRAGEIYVQSWILRDLEIYSFVPHQPVHIATPQQVADEILSTAPPWLTLLSTTGSGMRALNEVSELLSGIQRERFEVAPEDLAKNVALLAAERLKSGERDDPLTLSPLYLAPSNAERVLAEKLAREAAQ